MLLIDNYDSFTYNLVQAFAAMGASVMVYRNDAITVGEGLGLDVTHLVISPGPGRPEDAGVSLDMIDAFAGKVPILGVCLGHQSIVQHHGGRIVRAERLMHGKTSMVKHDGKTIFSDLPNPFEAGRYHSLIVETETVPSCLEVSAQTDSGIVMGLRHRDYVVEGVQFHPESILTDVGHDVLSRFLRSPRPVWEAEP